MSDSNFAVDLGTLDTVQYHPLGLEYVEPTGFIDQSAPSASRNAASRGKRVWKYVQFASGTTLTAGQGVARALGTSTYENCVLSPVDCSKERFIGFAQRALGAAGAVSYGWVLTEGVGLYVADTGGTTADRALIPGNGAAGALDDTGSSTADSAKSVGWAITGAAATGTATGRFKCVG